ncbi:hypothetical protein D3C84_1275220 [compost metagenome]
MQSQHHPLSVEGAGRALGLKYIVADVEYDATARHKILHDGLERVTNEIDPLRLIHIAIAPLLS